MFLRIFRLFDIVGFCYHGTNFHHKPLISLVKELVYTYFISLTHIDMENIYTYNNNFYHMKSPLGVK